MFNYLRWQFENNNPNPNNFCGGYALDAVFTQLIQGHIANPLETYAATLNIQNQQNDGYENNPNNHALINLIENNNLGNLGQGQILLPSSIASRGVEVNLTVSFTYNDDQLANNNVLAALINRVTGFVILNAVHDYNLQNALGQDALNSHWVVLVNGTHWIAIDRVEGVFSAYDPNNGVEGIVTILDNYIEEVAENPQNVQIAYNWGGVCIGFRL